MLLKEYLSIKKYQGRSLDFDIVEEFKNFLKRSVKANLTLKDWDILFDHYLDASCIYSCAPHIDSYPILVYRNPEESKFEVVKEDETISNFWRFLRRFKSFPDAFEWIKRLEEDFKEQENVPVVLPKIDGPIFDKQFVYLEWYNCLLDKKSVFVASSYDALKEAVEHNLEYVPESSMKDPEELRYSKLPARPFAFLQNTSGYAFAYYDPEYETKFALRKLSQEKKSKELSIMEKIERLKAEPAMKSILVDLVHLIRDKADKG